MGNLLRNKGAIPLIIAIVIFAGAGVLENGFVNYDDPQVLLNPGQSGKLAPTADNLADWLLPSPGRSWLPIRYLVFSTLHAIVGPAAWAFHLLSLLLYLVICLQVFQLARRLLAWDGFQVGDKPWSLQGGNFWPLLTVVVFALHPLNVESVAWVSATKDLLFAVFWLAFVLSILKENELKLTGNRETVLYLILAIAAKPAGAVLPLLAVTIAIISPYKVSRTNIPSRALAVVAVLLVGYLIYLLPHLLTMEVYRPSGGLDSIAAGALKALFAYVGSFLVPVELSVRYLVSVSLSLTDPATLARLSAIVTLCLLIGWWWTRGRRYPALALAWCLIAFIPSSGLIPMGILRADRYALTLMPIFAVSLAYGLRSMSHQMGPTAKKFVQVGIWIIPLCFGIMFVQRVEVWENSGKLWTNTLETEPRHWIALNGLAHWQLEMGDTTRAMDLYGQALKVNPNSVLALNSLALLQERKQALDSAESLLQRAGEIRNFDLETSLELAKFYVRHYRYHQAAELLERLDAGGTENAEMHYLLSVIYNKSGRSDWALSRIKAARALEPGNLFYMAEFGRLLVQRGEMDEAIEILARALEHDPDLQEAYVGFGELFNAAGQPVDAAISYYSALSRNPIQRDALLGLAGLLGAGGMLDSASVLLKVMRTHYPSDCMGLANSVALEMARSQWAEAALLLTQSIACDSTLLENYLNGYNIYTALDSLGRAAVMLSTAANLAQDNRILIPLRDDLEKRAGVPADTAIKYLYHFSSQNGGQVRSIRAAGLIDSLRN